MVTFPAGLVGSLPRAVMLASVSLSSILYIGTIGTVPTTPRLNMAGMNILRK